MYETTHHQTTGSRAVTEMPYDDDADELTDLEEQDPEGEGGMFEHFRFVADKGQQLLRVDKFLDRKSTRLNSSHPTTSRMPSSA